MKGWYKALEDLVWLTQLGLNMLLPLVMCLGGAWWAVNNWSWPEWVFLPAILLGLAAGAQNFWYFAARADCEEFLGCRVNLQCWVKVKSDWRDNEFLLNNFGFKQNTNNR